MPKQVELIVRTTMTVPDDMPLGPFKESFQTEFLDELNEDDMDEEWTAADLFDDVPSEYEGKRWTVKFEPWTGVLEDPETGEPV